MLVREIVISLVIFASLMLSAFGTLLLYDKLPKRYHHEDTADVVRQIASLFVVMTSLVLGLMVNSAKNTFEEVDHNVHVFATEIILLDRTLRKYGPETDETRQHLRVYVNWAITATAPPGDPLVMGDHVSERLLSAVGDGIDAILPSTEEQRNILQDAREEFRSVLRLRWVLLEQADGALAMPFLAMVVAWLVFVFATFGYRAPRNLVVVASLLMAAGLIAGSIYFILDMDVPFKGFIQVPDTPMRRALAELEH